MTHHHQTSSEPHRESPIGPRILLGLGVLILLVIAVLGALWINGSGPATETEDADRSAVRTKNLAELQAADTAALATYGWNDRAKGTVHLPITEAMKLVLTSLNSSATKDAATTPEQHP